MKACLEDLCTKIVKFVNRGLPKNKTVNRFGVNCSTVKRYLKQLEEGSFLTPKKAPSTPPKLA
jgi:transposase